MLLKIHDEIIESDRITHLKFRRATAVSEQSVDVLTVYFDVGHVDFRGLQAHAVLQFFESLALDIDPQDDLGKDYLGYRRAGGNISYGEFIAHRRRLDHLNNRMTDLRGPEVLEKRNIEKALLINQG